MHLITHLDRATNLINILKFHRSLKNNNDNVVYIDTLL